MKYDDISLRVADNGFILEYTEITKKEGADINTATYENTVRNYKKKVYPFEQTAEAVAEMKKMVGKVSNEASQALGETKSEG